MFVIKVYYILAFLSLKSILLNEVSLKHYVSPHFKISTLGFTYSSSLYGWFKEY